MVEAKLSDVLKVLKQVTQFNRSKVCTKQCNILFAALGHADDFFRKVDELGLGQGQASLVWDEAVAVLHRVVQLLKSCQEGNWIIRSLLSEESREEFQDVYTELYGCIELVSIHLFHLASSDTQRSRVSEAYNSCFMRRNSSSMLELGAVEDRKQLVRMALDQDEGKQSKSMFSALQMLCTMFVEKSPDGRFALDHKQLTLKKHIGQGAYGAVYEAGWLGHTFAVKVFSPGDPTFPKELAVLTSHKHPNILRIVGHSYDSEKYQYSLVMERMDMDLASFVKKKPLALDTALSILIQVASGMAWLHSKNVIHRDLKPQNVLVTNYLDDEHVVVRIADFGLARTDFISSLISEASSRRGTRNFMAPEVWNSVHYTRKADVYSYGMLCFQVLTGSMPFRDILENSNFMDLVCSGVRPELPTNLPTELGDIIRRCWSQEPTERPSFAEVREELKACKARLLTGSTISEGRSALVAFAAEVVQQSPSQHVSRTKVDLDSLISGTRRLSTGTTNGVTSRQSGEREMQRRSPLQSGEREPQRRAVVTIEDELFEMMRRGSVKDALNKALSLKSPSLVWFLCSQAQPSLLLSFDRNMVLSLAEHINNNMYEGTAQKLAWLNEAINIVCSDYSSWGSHRLERFFEQLSQNLHGQLAVTPRDSELAEMLVRMLNECNVWLPRVRNAITIGRYAM